MNSVKQNTIPARTPPQLKLLSVNIEGISMSLCNYLAKLLRKHKVELLLLQETHSKDASSPSKYIIARFTLISKVQHKKYGWMTYSMQKIHLPQWNLMQH